MNDYNLINTYTQNNKTTYDRENLKGKNRCPKPAPKQGSGNDPGNGIIQT